MIALNATARFLPLTIYGALPKQMNAIAGWGSQEWPTVHAAGS
jgi:hypothetical protein